MARHLTLIPGGSGLPGELIDTLPRQLIVEYPAMISMRYDAHTGQVTSIELQSMKDRGHLYDRETWHELPAHDTSVRSFFATFDPEPHTQTADIPVVWLEKDYTT